MIHTSAHDWNPQCVCDDFARISRHHEVCSSSTAHSTHTVAIAVSTATFSLPRMTSRCETLPWSFSLPSFASSFAASATAATEPTHLYFRNCRAGRCASNCVKSLAKRTCNSRGETYHLINLFERPVLHLRQVKPRPHRADEAGREPNISILGPPVQRVGVDKVRRRERRKPSAQEAHARS